MANMATINQSETKKFKGYANLAEAAHDLGLLMPNDVLTIAGNQPTTYNIDVNDIIYMRLDNNVMATKVDEVGYHDTNAASIADIYTWKDDKVNHFLIQENNSPNDAAAYQSLKNLALMNVGGSHPKLHYCATTHRGVESDLFFNSHDDSLTFHRIDGKCDYLDYKGYLIECSHVNSPNNSTSAIGPIEHWTTLKELAQPARIDIAAKAFWQNFVDSCWSEEPIINNLYNRIACLAYAIGYINPYIIYHLGNIYSDYASVRSRPTLSAKEAINDLIGIGILSKEQVVITHSSNPNVQFGYKCIASIAKINSLTNIKDYPASWADAFNDNVDRFYVNNKLIRFDLITKDNARYTVATADYRLADVLVDGLHDYLLRTTSAPVQKYLDECTEDISVYQLLETISGEVDFFPSDGDMALFHDCVTKYIIDTGYLTRYMQLLFALNMTALGSEHMHIDMLRCETIKYLMTNLDWITSIYDFDDAIMPIAKDYGCLNLGGVEQTVPYEYSLRRNFIAKILNINDQRYLADINRRIDDYIRDPSERLGHYDDIVYMNTLDWEE